MTVIDRRLLDGLNEIKAACCRELEYEVVIDRIENHRFACRVARLLLKGLDPAVLVGDDSPRENAIRVHFAITTDARTATTQPHLQTLHYMLSSKNNGTVHTFIWEYPIHEQTRSC